MLRRSVPLFLLLSACTASAPRVPAPAASPAPTPPASPVDAVARVTPGLTPPVAARHPKTTEIDGDTLVDDYFWLRNKGTPEVEDYLRAELAYARAFMQPTAALQQKLYDEMLARVQQTDTGVPYLSQGYWYYSRTEEGRQYPIFSRKQGTLEAPEQTILDVNQLAGGKQFMSVSFREVSPDGNLLAYGTDETGFRQYDLHVRDLRTGKDGSEKIPRVTSAAWFDDSRTLLYVVEDPVAKRSYRLYRHVVGAPEDELVYEEKDDRFELEVEATRDRRLLVVTSASHTTSEVRYVPAATARGGLTLIAPRAQGQEYYVTHRNGLLYIRANDTGRNFRIVTAPLASPGRASWKELVAERDDVMLEHLDLFRDFYVLVAREGGFPQLEVTLFDGGPSHRVSFPEQAYDAGPEHNEQWAATRYRFTYESPITPTSVYDYDPRTGERELLKRQQVLGGYDPSRYVVELTSARAPDGVAVPMWLLHRKDLVKDGKSSALLYGYGSYGISVPAYFRSAVFSLVDRGVTFAHAYVRGGGELGKPWHDAGRMMNKRNTFTDFIACAEHLVAGGYTSSNRLAIEGGSAGGLLMGAVTNLRPDLFAVVVAKVPFVDVVNTMLDESLPLTVGEFEEWGNPKIPEQYRYIRSYSPYDNVVAEAYPTMLVESSYNDSQVMYWEPAKYVAKLRALKTDANPLLFRIEMSPAGHGGKSGRYERLRDEAFDYAFILWQLGVERVDLPGAAASAAAR